MHEAMYWRSLPIAIVESGANPDDCNKVGINYGQHQVKNLKYCCRQTLADQDHATSSGTMSTGCTTQWILK